MANQVAARLAGDDYQHLYSWWHAIELLKPRSALTEVWIEDDRAGSFDDVTLHFSSASGRARQFFQVKYHVDQRSYYSTPQFLDQSTGSSLLQKFWRTWLRIEPTGNQPMLTLFSNWGWHSEDKLGECISGDDGRLTARFLSEGDRSDIGKLRRQWMEHCGASLEELAAFTQTFHLRLGSTNVAADVREHVVERMQLLGMRGDETALLLATSIVRRWIKAGVRQITRSLLESVLAEHDLRDRGDERSATVYLETVKKRRFDLAPDYLLDWRQHFEGTEYERGHRMTDPALWNGHMLPELQALEAQINREMAPRLIRARGLARLSAWFAFGYVFSRVSGYEIEVQQGPVLWRTDAAQSSDFELTATKTPDRGRAAPVLAVGLSVTGSLVKDMQNHLTSVGFGGSVLHLEPSKGPSREVFRSAADVVAFAAEAKKAVRHWIDETGAREVLLFYFGPLSGACFLGHDLNALGASITIMEDQAPGYANAFLLG